MPTFPRWFASLLDPGINEGAGFQTTLASGEVDLREAMLGGRYRLENLVGKGASSVVYRAHDTLLGQDVAIKVLRRDGNHTQEQSDALAHSLRNETRLSMRLSHPNILRIYHFEQKGNWEYEVMEYVEGKNLHQLAQSRPLHNLSILEVVTFGKLVLLALEHAHDHGVIHNDLKPANIMLCRRGGIKVCDFGLARVHGPTGHLRTVAGTPAFMSPERIRGEGGDLRSDLYSMAVTFFTLANGTTPYGDGRESLHGHLETPVPRRSAMPPQLHEVVARAMAKSPADRYPSARHMLAAWDAVAERMGMPDAHSWDSSDTEHSLEIRTLDEPPSLLEASQSEPEPRRSSLYQQQDRFTTDPSNRARKGHEPRHRAPAHSVTPPTGPRLVEDAPEPVAPEPRPPTGIRGPPLVEIRRARTASGAQPSGFLMERTPVTNDAFLRFVTQTQTAAPVTWKGSTPPQGRGSHPVTGVTLDQARAYARWLGRRLPTRAEWEIAFGEDGRKYPWGNDWRPDSCLGPHSGHFDTEAVGRHPEACGSGCLDLLGNVWEWTESDPDNPPPEPGKAWVCGGSYRHRCDTGRPVTMVHADNAYDYLGFRCAKDLP